MANVTYLISASNETYGTSALGYIRAQAKSINDAANMIGISAGAIAGAMAEENHAYGYSDKVLDLYARSGIDPTAAAVTLVAAIAAGPAGLAAWEAANLVALTTTRRTHVEWKAGYEDAQSIDNPGKVDKILHPVLIDAGFANFKISTAINLVIEYADDYPELGLDKYLNDYALLVEHLMLEGSPLTATLYAIYLKEEAEKFYIENNAYDGQWYSLPQEVRDALLITFTNRGLESMKKSKKELYTDKCLPYEPLPGLTDSGGMNHLLNAQDIGAAIGLAGYGDSLSAVENFASNALIPGESGLVFRYALFRLRYVAIPGLDYSTYNQNGELDLYDPATGQGLTNMYLADRAEMLTNLVHSYINDTTSTGTDVQYVDLPSNITLNKPLLLAPEKTIVFGGENSEVLEGTKHWLSGDNFNDRLYGGGGKDVLRGYGGDDYLEGGVGDDVLDGGTGNDILNGGSGRDIYMFGPNHGADTIIEVREADGFKHGVINYVNNSEIRIAYGTFTQDSENPDTWSAASGLTLVKGATWILTTPGGTIDLGEDFISGDFDIRLVDVSTETPEPGETTKDIFGDPIIYSATIAPGQEESDWKTVRKYNHEYAEGDDGSQVLIRYDVDYYRIDENGNPTEGGGEARDDIRNLHDTAGNDHFMSGGGDDDILLDKGGDDIVETGDGNDKVRITSSGNHVIDLGDGDDRLTSTVAALGNLIARGGKGRDYLGGGMGNDILEGGEGADALYGCDGDDLIFGDAQGDAGDFIAQGATQEGTGLQGEYVDGENGDDQIFTGAGNDLIFGGDGDDLIVSGGGDDYIWGDRNAWCKTDGWRDWAVTEHATDVGNGVMLYRYDVAHIFTEDDSGVGNDIIYAGAGNDVVFGERGDDIIYLEAGNDKAWGGEGADIIMGGDGDDLIHGDNSVSVIAEHLHGDDFLDGGAGNDVLYGGGGSDILLGGEGDDKLVGDDTDQLVHGDDYLDGGAGNDILIGNGGADVLLGGDGDDELHGDAGDTPDSLHGDDYLDGGAGNDLLIGYGGNDTLLGGDGDDVLDGDAGGLAASLHGDDYLDGGAGDDILIGNGGSDVLLGGEGNDSLHGDAADTPESALGDDYLDGGAGDDILIGYGGNDTLLGGTGVDYLDGGDGDDLYLIHAGDAPLRGSTMETIVDSSGNDTLRFGAGVRVEDLKFFKGSGSDLYISFGRDLLRIVNGWDGVMENFEFADGSRYSFEQLTSPGETANAPTDPGSSPTDPGTPDNSGLVVRIVPFEGEDEGGSVTLGGGTQSYYITIPGYGLVDLMLYDVQVYVDGTRISGWTPESLAGATIYGPDGNLFQPGAGGSGDAPVSGAIYGTEEDNILIGNQANNSLHGMGGNNLLIANAGYNHLYGGTGDNIFVAGSGCDQMFSKTVTSNDIYRFGRGDGSNYVDDRGGYDVLELGEGIGEEHVSLRRSNGHLVLSLDTGEKVTINDMFNAESGALNENRAIETIRFADGTEWDIDRMRREAVKGTDGDDVIYGFGTDDVMVGGAGNDKLYGIGGNNTLIGVSGDNKMYGGSGDNIFEAGSGSDLMISQHLASNDVYRFGHGDGHNIVRDFGGFDVIELGESIDPSQVTLRRRNMTVPDEDATYYIIRGGKKEFPTIQISVLVLTLDTGESLTVERMFNPDGSLNENRAIETIRFADGTEWDLDRMRIEAVTGTDGDDQLYGFDSDDVLTGGAGNDSLHGFGGNNTFIGGAGNNWMHGGTGNNLFIAGSGIDYMSGGAGDNTFVAGSGTGTMYSGHAGSNDVYRFGRGNGEYLIHDHGGNDRIELAEGLSTTDVGLRREGSDLLLTLDTGEQITVAEMFDEASGEFNGDHTMEAIRFADGTEWDLEQMRAELVRGTPGDDVIQGIAGGSLFRLEPGSGNDVVLPLGSNDHVVIGTGVAPERISLRMVRGDLVIALDTGDSVTVAGMFDRSTGALNEGKAIATIQFADGTVWDLDTIRSRAPSDFFVFSGGRHTINNTIERLNTLHFANGVGFSQVASQLTRFQNDLILKVGDTANQVTIRNFFLGGGNILELMTFSDGFELRAEQIFGAFGLEIPPEPVVDPAAPEPGDVESDEGGDGTPDDTEDQQDAAPPERDHTEGDDVLLGGVSENVLYGGAGNDLLVGGRGGNSYFYSSGQDVIDNRAGGAATLTFKEGITFSQVASGLVKSGDDLILRVDGGPDQIKIVNFFQGGVHLLQSIYFESGGSFTGEQIFGAFGMAVPENGPGPDDGSALAEGGGDLFVFTAGDGAQILDNSVHVRDTLHFVDIDFNQIASRLMKSGNDLILGVEGTSDRVTIRNWFLGGDNTVLTISFASGGQISADQIFGAFGLSNPDPERTPRFTDLPVLADFDAIYKHGTSDSRNVFGSTGNDFIQGGAGHDLLRGGAGDDYLIGGPGNDSYLFDAGDGADTINNYDPSGFDRILFGSSVATDSIAIFRNGDHLILGYGNNDRITVNNHFCGPDFAIDEVRLADGSYLTDAHINQLIQEMSAYAVAEGIALSSIEDVRRFNDLTTMVANSWQAA